MSDTEIISHEDKGYIEIRKKGKVYYTSTVLKDEKPYFYLTLPRLLSANKTYNKSDDEARKKSSTQRAGMKGQPNIIDKGEGIFEWPEGDDVKEEGDAIKEEGDDDEKEGDANKEGGDADEEGDDDEEEGSARDVGATTRHAEGNPQIQPNSEDSNGSQDPGRLLRSRSPPRQVPVMTFNQNQFQNGTPRPQNGTPRRTNRSRAPREPAYDDSDDEPEPAANADKDKGLTPLKILREFYLPPPYSNLSILQGAAEIKNKIIKAYLIKLKEETVAMYVDKTVPQIKTLFYGPPGCGKTFCIKGICGAISEEGKGDPVGTEFPMNEKDERDKKYKYPLVRLFDIDPSRIQGDGVGDNEKHIAMIWKTVEDDVAEKKERNEMAGRTGWQRTCAMLFLDEFDALGFSRGGKVVNYSIQMLLQVFDGARRFDGIRVIAATNLPWKLDSALLSRFQFKVFIDLPTDETRYQIMWSYARDMVTKYGISQTTAEDFARAVGTLTGVQKDADSALFRDIQSLGYDGKDRIAENFHSANGRRGSQDAWSKYGFSLRDIEGFKENFSSNFDALWYYLTIVQKRNTSETEKGYIFEMERKSPDLTNSVKGLKNLQKFSNDVFFENAWRDLIKETKEMQESTVNLKEYAMLVYYKLTNQVPESEEQLQMKKDEARRLQEEKHLENEEVRIANEEKRIARDEKREDAREKREIKKLELDIARDEREKSANK